MKWVLIILSILVLQCFDVKDGDKRYDEIKPGRLNAVYVDSMNGDDSNNGSSHHPFMTIDRALEVKKANAILVANGNYVSSKGYTIGKNLAILGGFDASQWQIEDDLDEIDEQKIENDDNIIDDTDGRSAPTSVTKTTILFQGTEGINLIQNETRLILSKVTIECNECENAIINNSAKGVALRFRNVNINMKNKIATHTISRAIGINIGACSAFEMKNSSVIVENYSGKYAYGVYSADENASKCSITMIDSTISSYANFGYGIFSSGRKSLTDIAKNSSSATADEIKTIKLENITTQATQNCGMGIVVNNEASIVYDFPILPLPINLEMVWKYNDFKSTTCKIIPFIDPNDNDGRS